MAPPSITRMNAQRKEIASGLQSPIAPSKVKKPAQESKGPKEPRMEYFSNFPAEIQQMIWSQAMRKPGCHTFKFVHMSGPFHGASTPDSWVLDLAKMPSNNDNSMCRYWQSLLWCDSYKQPMDVPEKKPGKKKPDKKKLRQTGTVTPKVEEPEVEKPKLEGRDLEKFKIEKANLSNPSKSMVQKSHEAFSKLANASFQAGFRSAMVQLEAVKLDLRTRKALDTREAAAIDVETDLVILEFNRGETARPNAWFEHSGMGSMDIGRVREKTKQLRRVAVHYKKTHADTDKRGPFQCWCQNPRAMGCYRFKACPIEQACFLDCFANLEEFYYVVEVTKKDELRWLHMYRAYVRRQNYWIETSEDGKKPKMKLTHFYDAKYEYIQLCPRAMLYYLPEQFWNGVAPLDAHYNARNCLVSVKNIYKSKTFKDDFNNSLEQRREVKFGILVTFKLYDWDDSSG